jgi:hypothetical protein
LLRGVRPVRPGTQGIDGDKIDDIVWYPISGCWEVEPDDRPKCLELHRDLAGVQIQDPCPEFKSVISVEALEQMNASTIHLERAKITLMRVLRSDGINQPTSARVPEYLQNSLIGLINSTGKVEATAVATRRFCPEDTQVFLNFLDLVRFYPSYCYYDGV